MGNRGDFTLFIGVGYNSYFGRKNRRQDAEMEATEG